MSATSPGWSDGPFDSLDVFGKEWEDVWRRRGVDPPRRDTSGHVSPPPGLVGLSLSGGGIRSATFNLGVLQALNDKKLLQHADYLSTVSGGGYIGGWWSAWRTRGPHARGTCFPPREGVETWRHVVNDTSEAQIEAARPATPDPVHHVRLFANYLTPRKGALSRDLWRAVTVITRNLVLTWAALLPFVAIAVMLSLALFLSAYGERPDGAIHLALPAGSDRLRAVLGLPSIFLTWFIALAGIWLLVQRGNWGFQSIITVVALGIVAWTVIRAASYAAPAYPLDSGDHDK